MEKTFNHHYSRNEQYNFVSFMLGYYSIFSENKKFIDEVESGIYVSDTCRLEC